MAEALYNASGLGLPIVMTVANRSDRRTDQHLERPLGRDVAAGLRLDPAVCRVQPGRGRPPHPGLPFAEELSLPVMVCMDGFVLTHAIEPVELPTQEQVDAFLPPFEPRQVLDPDDPVTIGAMVGPEAFAEVKYLMHAKQMQALDLLPEISSASSQASDGRPRLVRAYRSADAETIVALGSVLGTIEEVVDELRAGGHAHRRSRHDVLPAVPTRGDPRRAPGRAARRRPREGVRRRPRRHRRTEREARALRSSDFGLRRRRRARRPPDHAAHASNLVADVLEERLEPNRLAFLDLDWKSRATRSVSADRRSGPHAENILRDVGAVAASAHGGAR